MPRTGANEVPALKDNLIELSTDFLKWIAQFQCRVCGQKWEEAYGVNMHANVPSMRKVPNSLNSESEDHPR